MHSGYVQSNVSTPVRSFTESSPTKPLRMDTDHGLFTPRHDLSSAPPSSESIRPSFTVGPVGADAVNECHAPNIIIFGEAGVGKSSIINLIAGQKRAHASNDALGCTFEHQRHIVVLDEMPFAFWDTTGLDEGSKGTVPARAAESNLGELIQGLAHSGGIHLVIYCIRGTRLTKALKRNYDLFYTAVCRKKVHVALVVTGLEHQQGNMETWWDGNKGALKRYGMWFDAHACVTTLDVDDALIRDRQLESQKRLRDLVAEYASRSPWKIEASLISWAMFRNILSGVSSSGKRATRMVIVYDSTTSVGRWMRRIGDLQLEYELVYIHQTLPPWTTGKAGALVFYTTPLSGNDISPEDAATLKAFYEVAGGKTCPVIVVLRGCNDDQVAQRSWDSIALRYDNIHVHPVVDQKAKLDAMIEKLWIEPIEVKTSSRLLRAYEAFVRLFAPRIHSRDGNLPVSLDTSEYGYPADTKCGHGIARNVPVDKPVEAKIATET